MATATLEGRIYQPPKTLGMRKDASGQRVRVEVNRRVRKGWFQDEAGTVHFIMRVAVSPMAHHRARPTIGVGTLDKTTGTIDA